jgi:hypothetical protein
MRADKTAVDWDAMRGDSQAAEWAVDLGQSSAGCWADLLVVWVELSAVPWVEWGSMSGYWWVDLRVESWDGSRDWSTDESLVAYWVDRLEIEKADWSGLPVVVRLVVHWAGETVEWMADQLVVSRVDWMASIWAVHWVAQMVVALARKKADWRVVLMAL